MSALSPIRGETLVNLATLGDQSPAALAGLSGGGVVTAWLDGGSGASLANVRLFGPDGSPAAMEITIGAATDVQAAALAGGGFAVSWIEPAGARSLVHVQTFDALGRAVGTAQELAAYDEVLDLAHGIVRIQHPLGLQMTTLADGGYAATWTVQGQDSFAIKSIGFQLVVGDASGSVEANTLYGVTGGSKSIPLYDLNATPVQLASGQLMLTWFQKGVTLPASGDGFDAQHAQLFDLSGATVGAALHLDPLIPADGGPTVSGAAGLTATALSDGHVVFAWNQNGRAEFAIYPEAGLGLGNASGRAVPQIVGDITGAGAPQVIALGDGDFAVAWSGSGDGNDILVRLYSSAGVARGPAVRLGDIGAGSQDLPLLAPRGDGLAVLWRDTSHLATAGQAPDLSGTAVKLQLLGPVGGDTPHSLIGTAGSDALLGGAGEDWLNGVGGADTLTGGFGPDKFIFGPAAGADRVLDFTPGQDHLLLVDALGRIADGALGVLTLDVALHAVSWDSDGDGPAPSEDLAVLDGVTRLGRSDLAAAFQPRAIRLVAADGSAEQTVFDWGASSLDTAVAALTPTRATERYTANFDDGSRWTKWFDVEGTQPWVNRTAEYDASGALFRYTVADDAGGQVQWAFDPHNLQVWQRVVDAYDAAGRQLTRAVLADDGSAKVATFDVDNSHPWRMLVDVFDAAGRQVGHWTYNDDGSFVA